MALTVVRPSEWGMPPITEAVDTRALSAVVEANVHHSDSTPPGNHRDCAAAVRGFDTYHRQHNGWSAIGYHRVICAHGVVFLGRGLDVVPAAAKDHNTPIVAYCLIGKAGAATADQWSALLLMAAADAGHVGRPLRWTTHREVWPHTECPGNAIQHQVDEQRRTHGPTTAAAPPRPRQPEGLSVGTRLAVRHLTRSLNRRRRPPTAAATSKLHALAAAIVRALNA